MPAPSHSPNTTESPLRPRDWLILLALAAGAVLLHGYHFGVQDQFVYVPAIKHHLNLALYPGDTEIFQAQTRWMLWDNAVALSIRVTRLPVEWAIFLWHWLSIYLLLLGCLQVARRCFVERAAQWAAVAAVAAMLLLAAGGSLLFLADPYLHPRTLATAFLLLSFAATLDRKWIAAAAWLALAGAMHPSLALIGALHLLFQAAPARVALGVVGVALAAGLLTGGVGAEREAWREALESRWFLFPLRWPWFAWLGAIVPLGLLLWWSRADEPRVTTALRSASGKLVFSGATGVAVAFAIALIPRLERWVSLESMRVLHLLTLLTVLLGGGLLGQHVLRRRPLRWLLLFVPLCGVMFYFQRQLYPGSPHIEWPGRATGNAWVEAFQWVRHNTPPNARFALDPQYQEIRGEDFHDFRAIAERPALMNYSKDRAVAANFPALAPLWREQMRDLQNWKDMTRGDFLRLHERYAVGWVIVQSPPPGLDCAHAEPGESSTVYVCKIQ